jgi:hypothetical protein
MISDLPQLNKNYFVTGEQRQFVEPPNKVLISFARYAFWRSFAVALFAARPSS